MYKFLSKSSNVLILKQIKENTKESLSTQIRLEFHLNIIIL